MQMKDRLPRVRANVIDRTKAVLESALARNFCRHELAIADELRIGFRRLVNPNDMLLGNDQDMRRSLRLDVFEDKGLVIFINFF